MLRRHAIGYSSRKARKRLGTSSLSLEPMRSRMPKSAALADLEHASTVVGAIFFAAVGLAAVFTVHTIAAVYIASFWQYLVYAMAFLERRVSLDAFQRDALLTRSASLVAFGWAYLSQPISVLSLMLVAAGFALNAAAVRALGADRTYYGVELAGLPPKRVEGFPYSWMSHPMLVGNMAAFGGALLNFEFARQWWPLAVLHVALNLAIILMEAYVRPPTPERRPAAKREKPLIASAGMLGLWGLLGAGVGVGIGAVGRSDDWMFAGPIGAAAGIYFGTIVAAYVAPPMFASREPVATTARG